MRKVSPGFVCIVLGVVLLLAAGGLYAYNRYEDAHAGAEAQNVVADLQQKVVQQKVEPPEPEAESGPLDPELPVVEIDGNEYVGEISIPAIGIDLPVMSEWSYPRLKIAPCRQFGSSRTDDLVHRGAQLREPFRQAELPHSGGQRYLHRYGRHRE